MPRSTFAERLAIAISDDSFDQPAEHVLRAYLDDASNTGGYDGRFFEVYGAADTTAFRVSPADLVAVTCLSMEIAPRSTSGFTARAAVAIENAADRISELLVRVPADIELHALDADEFGRWVGPGSPSWALWDLLRREIGTPKVATYKLLARKRPHLLPIRDSATSSALGHGDAWWEPWWRALVDDPSIVERLKTLRHEANAPHLSVLRVADIVIWMRRTRGSAVS